MLFEPAPAGTGCTVRLLVLLERRTTALRIDWCLFGLRARGWSRRLKTPSRRNVQTESPPTRHSIHDHATNLINPKCDPVPALAHPSTPSNMGVRRRAAFLAARVQPKCRRLDVPAGRDTPNAGLRFRAVSVGDSVRFARLAALYLNIPALATSVGHSYLHVVLVIEPTRDRIDCGRV
jgi:hypothetical protein